MPDWKRVKITFPTVKLGQFIEPVKRTVVETSGNDYRTVYGVTNTEGIVITGKKVSEDRSNYIAIDKDYFVYNPYRINVGSVGFNDKGIKGCVSPAYVVFKTRSGLSPGFLHLYLKSDFGNHLINWYGNRGGVRNALRYDDLCDIDVPKIDFNEQTRLLQKIKCIAKSVNDFDKQLREELKILKKLRQAVFHEAINGKLTAQWRKQNHELISGDNHASKLLEKIKVKKERLIREGKIKKDKPLPPIADDEKPFDLPEGWVWCRLGEICDFITKGTTPPAQELKNNGDIPYLKVYNIVDQKIDFFYRAQFISVKIHEKLSRSKVYPGDVLMNIVGPPLGKVAIVPRDFNEWNINQALAIFRPIIKEINQFLYTYFLAGLEIKKIHTLGIVGQDNISLTQCRDMIFPLPTLAEQQGIVKRISELTAMIDELEKKVAERKDQTGMLMQSVLREAFAG